MELYPVCFFAYGLRNDQEVHFMDLIPSFAVDHTKIVPGIFESRVDTL